MAVIFHNVHDYTIVLPLASVVLPYLVWMFHSRALNNRIIKLHERGLCLVYKDLHLTFDELLHHRNLQKFAIEMYKIHNNLSPSIMKTIFPERSMPYNLRNNIPFKSTNANTVYYGTETLSFKVRKPGH